MSQVDASRQAFTVVRPQGRAPPSGFLCNGLVAMLREAARASGQTNASAVSPGGFFRLEYKGRAAEAAFARGVPTCSRLIQHNPSNALEWNIT